MRYPSEPPSGNPRSSGTSWGHLAGVSLLIVSLGFGLMGGLWILLHDFSGIQWVEILVAYAVVVWVGVFAAYYFWRKRNQEFAESKELYEHIINASQDGILFLEAIHDSNGDLRDFKVSVANQAVADILGIAPAAFTLRGLANEGIGNSHDELVQRCLEVMRTGIMDSFEIRIHAHSPARWLMLRAGRLKDGLVLGFSDITEQKNTLEQLRQEGELFRIAGRMAAVGGWNVQFPSRVVTWSPELCLIHEIPLDSQPTLEEILGFYLPEGQVLVRQAFLECLAHGTPYDLEVELITAKGNRIWVRGIGEADFENGVVRRIYGTLQNITEAKLDKSRLEVAIAQEQELARKALAAERAKSEFLAMMSHEIRTPMNGILGFTELLEQAQLPAEPREYVQIIHSSSKSLLRIIDDILDFSRIESGDVRRERVVFSTVEVIDGILTLLGPQARKKGLEMKAVIEPGLPTHGLGDPGHLRQILINLVGNAIKFTPLGRIELRLRRVPSSTGKTSTSLEFSVADTGGGIPPDALPLIFSPFTQADSRIARRHTGTGLGLAISQRLAALMDGSLEVQQTSDKGTVMALVIPFEVVSEAPVESVASTAFDDQFAQTHTLRVLVADDEPVNLKLICHVLRRAGYEPLVATNGAEAVAIFRAEHPDCVLMDMQMPEMDGMEATANIRKYEMENGRSPAFITALTANVMPSDRQRCLDAGMNDHLAKPMKKDALARVLKQAYAMKPPRSENG